jgi:hypothetical protein
MLYQFNEIYYKIIGEYENGIRIIFISDTQRQMLVYEQGCFYLVNQPARINLNGYEQSSLDSQSYFGRKTKDYNIQQIFEYVGNSAVYIKLEDAIIKIAMHFYTGDGQMVENFWVSDERSEPETYKQWSQEIEAARIVEITDFRFALD